MTKRKKSLELRVIFDTSAIYTGSASDLLRKEILDIIVNYSKLPDLEINWYLPEIVVEERRFQMNKRGKEFLPQIIKLEKLLGHNLNITEDIIQTRVNETIQRQINNNRIQEIKIDPDKINWKQLISNSTNRVPPFEDGEKEKGFRDALIIECVQHLIDESPTTSNICRLAFLSSDSLLLDAARDRFGHCANFRLCGTIEELTSLINILTSEIKEELINSISETASNIFFVKEDNSSLYYKEGIRKTISEKFSSELNTLPESATRREEGTWWINKPGFVKKVGQRIYWKSIVEIDSKTFKTTYSAPTTQPSFDIFNKPQTNTIQDIFSKIASGIKEETVKEGKSKIEVLWSVTLTTSKQLKNPKVEDINFVETVWK